MVLVTKPFASQAKAMAAMKGVPGYGSAFINHPNGSLSHDELSAQAERALPQVLELLLA